ncbi:hypothetical protein [Sphingomonas immobilis]|uniref:DUF3558 domain-containing protein n=1 Tax=Sphingomonas immobilis TaxID=3063997 RepID=A0ABT8ZX38_9SPHN|nr:hypothetical protein [Sphingomonas sp. CA1-15]MDO7841848.1 hypothetical protein [Sphingomonas sp. CA1-15]
MVLKHQGFAATLVSTLLISACGSGGSTSTADSINATDARKAAGPSVTNACALIDKSVVASVLGSGIKSAELSAVKDGAGGTEQFSQCAYTFESGKMIVVSVGQSPDNPGVEEIQKRAVSQTAIVSNTPPVKVDGVGKAALWSPDMHMLQVYLEGGRFYYINMASAGGDEAQATAVTLAHKLGA